MNRKLLLLCLAVLVLILLTVGTIYASKYLFFNKGQPVTKPITYNGPVSYEPLSAGSAYTPGAYEVHTSNFTLFTKIINVTLTHEGVIAQTPDFKLSIFDNKRKVFFLVRSNDPNDFHSSNQKAIIIKDKDSALNNIQPLSGKLAEISFTLTNDCNKNLLSYLKGNLQQVSCVPTAGSIRYYEE